MTFFAQSPGKCILFGEHSVVHGYPAIATSIGRYSKCEIERNQTDNICLTLNNYDYSIKERSLSAFREKIDPSYHQFASMMEYLHHTHRLDFKGLNLTLSSDLYPSAGLGSSASVSVAFIAALLAYFELNFDKAMISELAFKMEQDVHGTPSGIDNTICTFGKTMRYQQGKFKEFPVHSNLKFIISYTNMIHDTKAAIQRVHDLKKRNPKLLETLFEDIGRIVNQAEIELTSGNKEKLGVLLNQNQSCLEKMNVSNDKISELISIALSNGALGSKLTGAGIGGCVISLTTEDNLDYVCRILCEKGFDSFVAPINKEGVIFGKSE